MNVLFYLAVAVALFSTLMVVTRLNAIHALLYLIVSLLAVAVIFYTLGAPFVAALEVIIYAGAIMVLFVFAVMILNLGPQAADQERQWFNPRVWTGPAILAAVLIAEMIYILVASRSATFGSTTIAPGQVGASLFGPYVIGVELASLVLLAGLVGAYHLGRRHVPSEEEEGQA